jgi:hypothetical protein
MVYRKSQTGWILIWIFVPIIAFLYLAYLNHWGNHPITFGPFVALSGLFILIAALFFKLTVEVEDSVIRVIYGIGLIRIMFRIDQLESVETLRTPWYYGLGIRVTPQGMLYNIHGTKAVRVNYLREGKRKSVMIGTPEPERLKAVLDEHFMK